MGVPTVAVVGGGAIGGFLAGAVHDAGHPVTLCLRTPIDALTVRTGARVATVPARLVTDPAGETPVEWLLVATKAQDTPAAAGWLSALAGASTTVVVLQNGVDHADRVGSLIGKATLLPALVYVAAERPEPGLVVHRGGNRLVVPAGAAGRAFGELLAGSGLRVEPVADFRTEAWRKLLTNVAANPITALTLRRLGVLAEPDVAELARAVLAEGVAAAAADGAALGPDEIARTVRFYRRFGADDGTSMLYDRLAGRPLEADLITGAVVAAADRHHVPVPLNRALLALLRAVNR
ncbi:MAG TPA: 2-dehydropantoate 2-reductase [Actinocatenispora sp.]